jgi:hypothetical protein
MAPDFKTANITWFFFGCPVKKFDQQSMLVWGVNSGVDGGVLIMMRSCNSGVRMDQVQ